jgi:hypothetical protein
LALNQRFDEIPVLELTPTSIGKASIPLTATDKTRAIVGEGNAAFTLSRT